jgi:hypothetical protein
LSQGTVFYGLDNRRSVTQPHLLIPYTLDLDLQTDMDKGESSAEFLQRIPNEFPYLVLTKPKIDYNNNTISLIAGSLMKDMGKERADDRISRYIQSYGPRRLYPNYDVDKFRDIFMTYLCDHCRELNRNKGLREFVIPISKVYENPNLGGFGIQGWEEPYIRKKLLPSIANEGFIEILDTREGSFKVTDIGISYCAQIKHPIN